MLSFHISIVNYFRMLIVVFIFLLGLFLKLFEVLNNLLVFIFNDFLVFLTVHVILAFLLFEESLLVVRHLNRIIDIFGFVYF